MISFFYQLKKYSWENNSKISHHFKVEFGQFKVDSDVEADSAGADGRQELGHVISVVEQVDEGVVVQGERLEDFVPQRLDIGQRLRVDVRKTSDDVLDRRLQGLFRQKCLK